MTSIQKNIHLKGYRRGKAPRWLIEKKYASGIEPEVAEKLIDRIYKNADKPFQVVGRPQLVDESQVFQRKMILKSQSVLTSFLWLRMSTIKDLKGLRSPQCY